MLHTVIQFWKIGDFLFFSSSWQVLEESAILCGFRFIPAIFQQHTSQLLTVKEMFHSVILESAIEKGSQYTDQSCQNDSHYPIWCDRQMDTAILKKRDYFPVRSDDCF